MTRPFKVVIPARYGSTRFPGKVLADMHGRPMIVRVYEQACRSGAEAVIVATDDERVERAAREYGADVAMTGAGHRSGSDRIAEVARRRGWADEDIIVNVQGDEPLIPPENIDQVAANITAHEAPMATLVTGFTDRREREDTNNVKVVTDRNGFALYFSRAVIPFDRDGGGNDDVWLRHIGLYAYRAGFLKRFTAQPPARCEQVEQLEQLRALWLGERIHADRARVEPPRGVDTPEDLAYLLEWRER